MITKFLQFLVLLLMTLLAFGQSKIPNDTLKIGRTSTVVDKGIIFETNDGANNKKLLIEQSSKLLKFDGNEFRLGDASAGDKSFIFNNNNATNPKLSVDFNADTLIYNKDNITIGDGTDTDKIWTFDKGGSNPFLKYDSGTGKIVFSNDGTIENAIGAEAGATKDNTLLSNAGFSISAAANAMTVALKQADGSTDPTSPAPVNIAFRGATDTVADLNVRTTVAALSLVIPDGATLGTVNAVKSRIYIYAIDNAGTIELAVGNTRLDGSEKVISTIILDTSSDAANVLYSTVARSNVPVRIIGFFESTQGTAGTWASNPTLVGIGDHAKSVIKTCFVGGQDGTPSLDTDLCNTWIDSVDDNGVGLYDLNLTIDIFSGIPHCVGTSDLATQMVSILSSSTSLVALRNFNTGGTIVDIDLYIICVGKR